jgi:hypothetical protein
MAWFQGDQIRTLKIASKPLDLKLADNCHESGRTFAQ